MTKQNSEHQHNWEWQGYKIIRKGWGKAKGQCQECGEVKEVKVRI